MASLVSNMALLLMLVARDHCFRRTQMSYRSKSYRSHHLTSDVQGKQ